MYGRWLAVLALAATALAGCSDDGGEGGDAAGEHDGHSGQSRFGGDTGQVTEAPEWALGDWWSYTDSQDRTHNLVVAQDAGSDWTVLSNDLQIALFDFRFDISYVGPISKSDLAGDQGGQPIRFLDFPLEHGKSWNTQWDGESRHVVAHAADGGKWHIIAHAGGDDSGDKYAEYVFDPEAGWFESMTFFNTTDGSVAYGAELTGSGSDFTGTLYAYTEIDEVLSLAQSGPGATQGTFSMDSEQEVQIDYGFDCGTTSGMLLFGVMAPGPDGEQQPAPPLPVANEPDWGSDPACPGAGEETGQVVLDGAPGTWRADGMVGNGDGSYEVGISLRSYDTFAF